MPTVVVRTHAKEQLPFRMHAVVDEYPGGM